MNIIANENLYENDFFIIYFFLDVFYKLNQLKKLN